MFNKVFISYAAEDFEYAEKLYDFLKATEFDPWMDKKKLLPGQKFDFFIQHELKNAHFLILLLSDISVTKRGYIQKEFKTALKYWEEKLIDDIYLIPLKIDACEVPIELSQFQWQEYSSENSFKLIYQSLTTQRERFLEAERKKQARLLNLSYKEEVVKNEYGNRSPKQTYEISYPKFDNQNIEATKELNTIIHSQVVKKILEARKHYFNFLQNINPEEDWETSDSVLYGNTNFQILSKNFVSYTHTWYEYSTGAAHGNYYTKGKNFSMNPLQEFKFCDLFENYNESLIVLRDLVHEQIMKDAKEQHSIKEPEEFYFLEEGLECKKENFENYYFTDKGIVFVFNPYHLTAWSFGSQHPEISFEVLKKSFPTESKLQKFIETIIINKNQ